MKKSIYSIQQILILFLSMSILSAPNLLGQESNFRVLVAQGNNVLNKTENQPVRWLKSGDTLVLRDELEISNDSYVGLVHNSGQTLELTKAGRYLISDLHKEVNGQANIARRQLNVLWSKVFAALDRINEKPTKFLGLNTIPTGVDVGKLQLVAVHPKKLNPVYNERVEMHWTRDYISPNTRYIVNVKNIYDELLISEMVDQPKFTLDFSDKRLLENQPQIDRQILSFVVYSADNQDNNSWRYGLTRINGTTAEQVQTEVQFFKDVISPMTFLDDLIMATYYEEKGLLLDALTTYENLMKKAPGIEGFEMLYNSFVWRRLQKIQTREMGG